MKKLAFIILPIILVACAAVVLVVFMSNQHSESVQSKLKDIYIQDLSQGYYKDDPDDVKIVGYKDFGNTFQAIDLQLLNVGHGARYGVNIDRVVFEVKEDNPKLATIMPENKVSLSKPNASDTLPANTLQQILEWPLSPAIHIGETTAFDFYSGDLTEVSRTKLTDWLVNATIDTRLTNISVRKGSYSKIEDVKLAYDDQTHKHTYEKTLIKPAITVSFTIDILHPKSSYKVTQRAHKESPALDTIYLSCIESESNDDDIDGCGEDIKL